MFPNMEERIAYGRAIRHRAMCLIESYGAAAETEALRAAEEPGLAAAERSFWHSVANRVSRHFSYRDIIPAL
jgi:hypothetical protein